jgi:methylthioribose-1-phosphate isomerase
MEIENKIQTLAWNGKSLKLIDQRKLPFIKKYVVCDIYEKVAGAIKDMVVRGAPAIGVAAAYGAAIASIQYKGNSKSDFNLFFKKALSLLASSRPTAVNLFWALDKMEKVFIENKDNRIEFIRKKLIDEARQIESEDIKINKKIGENGVKALKYIKGKIKIFRRRKPKTP